MAGLAITPSNPSSPSFRDWLTTSCDWPIHHHYYFICSILSHKLHMTRQNSWAVFSLSDYWCNAISEATVESFVFDVKVEVVNVLIECGGVDANCKHLILVRDLEDVWFFKSWRLGVLSLIGQIGKSNNIGFFFLHVDYLFFLKNLKAKVPGWEN